MKATFSKAPERAIASTWPPHGPTAKLKTRTFWSVEMITGELNSSPAGPSAFCFAFPAAPLAAATYDANPDSCVASRPDRPTLGESASPPSRG